MTRKVSIPYTADDLIRIGNMVHGIVEQIEPKDGAGFLEDGDWRWNMTVDVIDPERNESVGQIRAHGDGWLAFYPWEPSDG